MLSLDTMVEDQLLVCPRCNSSVQRQSASGDAAWRCTQASCRYAERAFPVVAGIPALVDFERSILDEGRLRAMAGASQVRRSPFAARLARLLHPANEVAPAQVRRMLMSLRRESGGRNPRILVVGGGTVGAGLDWLYTDSTVDLISFDIYASKEVQFIADGHAIPLASGSLDGVVVQAVLEHVVQPSVVVAEIARVLRTGGMVYADTPFMQQVHEGAYDFTRFTDSGHRFLFHGFESIESGLVAGAGTALRWSIGYFVRALTRSVLLGRLAALSCFWLSHVDRVLDPRHSLDAASSVFFLGRKSDRSTPAKEIVGYYQGGA